MGKNIKFGYYIFKSKDMELVQSKEVYKGKVYFMLSNGTENNRSFSVDFETEQEFINHLKNSTVISNIRNMQNQIGVNISSVEWLLKKSYDDLHDEQNSLIKHYNQAIKNARLKTKE